MERKYIIITSLLACTILYFVEQVLVVNYMVKTIAKILLFTLIPYYYIRFIKRLSFKDFISFKTVDKHHLKLGLFFGLGSFIIIFITYYLLQNIIDFGSIVDELQHKSKITPTNFTVVGLYITFGNSFLEEFFFRGFIFLNLYQLRLKKTAYVYSSLLFAFYHIAIFKTWFNIWLIGLALIGLIVIGFIFNWLNTKSKNFLNSWIVHILADSAIILIGMRLFNII